jgi:hypothetical protein
MHNLSDTVENQLLLQTAQGDQIAFTQLFDAWPYAFATKTGQASLCGV